MLAAGESKRFGALKQLALIDGIPVLQHTLDHCRNIANTDLYLALGASHQQIETWISFDKSRIIINEHWQRGIGSTLSTAVKALGRYPAILFIAGDQPLVQTDQLLSLIAAWRQQPQSICAARYQQTLGIPALFPRDFFAQLSRLEGDQGAKGILQQQTDIQILDIPEAAMDIDYPEDIDRLLAARILNNKT